jgi:hypothetical protein
MRTMQLDDDRRGITEFTVWTPAPGVGCGRITGYLTEDVARKMWELSLDVIYKPNEGHACSAFCDWYGMTGYDTAACNFLIAKSQELKAAKRLSKTFVLVKGPLVAMAVSVAGAALGDMTASTKRANWEQELNTWIARGGLVPLSA